VLRAVVYAVISALCTATPCVNLAAAASRSLEWSSTAIHPPLKQTRQAVPRMPPNPTLRIHPTIRTPRQPLCVGPMPAASRQAHSPMGACHHPSVIRAPTRSRNKPLSFLLLAYSASRAPSAQHELQMAPAPFPVLAHPLNPTS